MSREANKRGGPEVKALDDSARQLAEAAARVIAEAEEIGLPDPPDLTPHAFRLLARAHVELRDQVRALHDLVDQTDPHDPIGVALTRVGLARRPAEVAVPSGPRLVYAPLTPGQVAALSPDELLKIYCRAMHEVAEVFVKYETYVVRGWDGMDGCWTDCTAEVDREEALRVWAARTDGGAHRVAYAEIDYYRIFPGGTRMHWDGSEKLERTQDADQRHRHDHRRRGRHAADGQEMHR